MDADSYRKRESERWGEKGRTYACKVNPAMPAGNLLARHVLKVLAAQRKTGTSGPIEEQQRGQVRVKKRTLLPNLREPREREEKG